MEILLDHVALLVTDIERALGTCERLGLCAGDVSEFAEEGTRECYVGSPDESGRLLLMQAISPGPYQDALNKRGPGIHHLAYRVKGMGELEAELVRAGWRQLTQPHLRSRWFARSGCVLLELHDADRDDFSGTPFQCISAINLPHDVEPYKALRFGRGQIESSRSEQAIMFNARYFGVSAF